MSQHPMISVCIANYNGEKFIASCLDSVLDQNFQGPVEIIVHDDASTDDSVAHIEKHYPKIKLIKSPTNVGFCISNNRMAEQARGRYLLFLNNDAALYPDALSTLFEFAELQTKPTILGLPQYDMETEELIDIGSLLDPFLNPVPNKNPDRREVAMVIGACLWIPKTLWREIGGFPEWFQNLAEDMYVCSVARLWGYPVIALAESGFRHWVGRSLGGGKVRQGKLKTTYKRRYMSERNKTYVMILCFPTFAFLLMFPLHLALFCIEGIVLSSVKRDFTIWRRIYGKVLNSLWRSRYALFQERTKIQSNRRRNDCYFFGPFVGYPYKLTMLIKHGLPSLR